MATVSYQLAHFGKRVWVSHTTQDSIHTSQEPLELTYKAAEIIYKRLLKNSGLKQLTLHK